MCQTILVFSGIAVSLLVLLNLRRFSVLSGGGDQEIWTLVFAIAFILMGGFISRYVTRNKKPESATTIDLPEEALRKIGITQREYEVLRLVAAGHSNLEISKELFISESTVKTHVSNVLVKLDAKRRTQAVQRAKELRIL